MLVKHSEHHEGRTEMTREQATHESLTEIPAGRITIAERQVDIARRMAGDLSSAETRREQVLSSLLLVTL